MIAPSADVLPIWMLLSAAFGFIAGEAFGDSSRHRKCLQQSNDNLRDQLENARISDELLHQAVRQNRKILNDLHKRVSAVTKGLEKASS